MCEDLSIEGEVERIFVSSSLCLKSGNLFENLEQFVLKPSFKNGQSLTKIGG